MSNQINIWNNVYMFTKLPERWFYTLFVSTLKPVYNDHPRAQK